MARSGAAAARRAHNPKVVGSNPTSATIQATPGAGPTGSFSLGSAFARIHLESIEQEEAGGAGKAPDQEAQAEGSGTGGALGSFPGCALRGRRRPAVP